MKLKDSKWRVPITVLCPVIVISLLICWPVFKCVDYIMTRLSN